MAEEVRRGAHGLPHQSAGKPGALFDEGELRALAAAAATLSERFSGMVVPAPGAPNAEADRTFAEWKRAASDDDDALFARVLARHGVDEVTARPLLGAVALGADQPCPNWATVFARCFAALVGQSADAHGTEGAQPGGDAPEQPAWAELFWPLARAASGWRDEARAGGAPWGAAGALRDDLERLLTERLAEAFKAPLDDALAVHRALSAGDFTGLSVLATPGPGNADTTIGFIRELRERELKRLFKDRPVLARLLATVVSQWMETTAEFLNRLARDREGPIAALAPDGLSPGRAIRVEGGLSDPHKGGRSVLKVTFESGLSLAYKPKPLEADVAFHRLLAWLAGRGAPASADAAPVADCGSYGWAVWVDASPCQSMDEVGTFFRRSGALLCLLRVLRASDFHHENMVAVGGAPVPVDLETILHPETPVVTSGARGGRIRAARTETWRESVARTEYLPGWALLPGGGAVVLGGLEAQHREIEGDRGFRAESERLRVAARNLPVYENRPIAAADHVDTFVAGYRAMFDFLRAHGAEMVAPGGPQDEWAAVRLRFLMRSTQTYALVERRSMGRRAVTNGARWSLHFDHLHRLSNAGDRDLPEAQLIAAECEALARWDVPRFEAAAGGTDVHACDGRAVPHFFRTSCLDAIAEGIDRLDDAALAFDERLIRHALASSRAAAPPLWAGAREALGGAESDGRVGHRALMAATKLAAAVQAAALRTDDAIIWLGRTFVATDERAEQFSPIGKGFSSGTTGIALFLAAAARVEPDHTVRRALLDDVHNTLWWAHDMTRFSRPLARSDQPHDLGLAHGLGGTLYGLAAIGSLAGRDDDIERAVTIARWIKPRTIKADRNFGVFGGAAGLAMGLAALHALRPGTVCEQIDACRALLIERCVAAEAGRAWPHASGRPALTGLMHGAAGIALALARLPDPDARTRQAIEDALVFEDAMDRRWRGMVDQRDNPSPGSPRLFDYSNGVAGRAVAAAEIARATGLAMAADRSSAARERDFLRKQPPTDDLHNGRAGQAAACCAVGLEGEAGSAEIAGILGPLLDGYEAHGKLRWRIGDDVDNLGFANGTAGVGLMLLHVAAPERVPNVAVLPVPSAFGP